MNAETIAALGGRKVGGWIARCPVNENRVPSLAITQTQNGTVLLRCHAKAAWRARDIAAFCAGEWQPEAA